MVRWFAVAVSAWTTFATSALALEPVVVRVGGACLPPDTSMEETLRILAAEFPSATVRVLGRDDTDAHAVTAILDACTMDPPTARVLIYGVGGPRARLVDFTDVPVEARDRTLALALAESLRASQATVEEAAPTAAIPPAAPAVATWQAPPPGADRRVDSTRSMDGRIWSVYGHGLVRYVARTPNVAPGAELGVAFQRFGAGAMLLTTSEDTRVGTANALAAAVAPWVDIVDVAPHSHLCVRGELGFVTASGDHAVRAAHTVTEFHGALSGCISASVPLGPRLALDAHAGAGYASSVTVRAGGHDAGGFDGVFAEAGIGLRY